MFQQPLLRTQYIAQNWNNLRDVICPAPLAAAYELSIADAKRAKFQVPEAQANEILAAYNKVVADGRFVRDFGKEPAKVAKELGIRLSDAAAGTIAKAGAFKGANPGGPISDDVSVVCVAIIVVVCCVARNPDQEVIIDSSGALKL